MGMRTMDGSDVTLKKKGHESTLHWAIQQLSPGSSAEAPCGACPIVTVHVYFKFSTPVWDLAFQSQHVYAELPEFISFPVTMHSHHSSTEVTIFKFEIWRQGFLFPVMLAHWQVAMVRVYEIKDYLHKTTSRTLFFVKEMIFPSYKMLAKDLQCIWQNQAQNISMQIPRLSSVSDSG